GQGAGQLEPTLVDVAQLSGDSSDGRLEVEKSQQLERLGSERPLVLAAVARQQPSQAGRRTPMLSHEHGLEHREMREQAHVLERTRETEASNAVRREAADVPTEEPHATLARPLE